MVYLVAGVTDRVEEWCDGVVASGGIRRGGEERDGDDGVADSGRGEEVVVDGRRGWGGGGGEGGVGGSLFSFHVEPGFLRDGGSVGKGVSSLVEFSQNVVEVGFLRGGVGVDELVNGVKEFEVVRKKMVVVWVVYDYIPFFF